jgi:hypothetical protein
MPPSALHPFALQFLSRFYTQIFYRDLLNPAAGTLFCVALFPLLR